MIPLVHQHFVARNFIISVLINMYQYVSVCIRMYHYVYVSLCVCISMCMYQYVSVCIRMYQYVCVYVNPRPDPTNPLPFLLAPPHGSVEGLDITR